MGREAMCICQIGTERAPVKALLESTELILRGAIRRRIAVASLRAVVVEAGTLRLTAGAEVLALELGAREAALWAKKLCAPAPTLASKLGISAARPAFVIGSADDPTLAAALRDTRAATPDQAAMTIAVVLTLEALADALAAHEKLPHSRHLWIVSPKGPQAGLPDSQVRAFMRERGYADSKSSAVSAALTATRYAAG